MPVILLPLHIPYYSLVAAHHRVQSPLHCSGGLHTGPQEARSGGTVEEHEVLL